MENLLTRLGGALAGRYNIERELGHGGTSFVFLAHDLKHHRPVAIKVLRPELAIVVAAQRFLREIEIAANLAHPHILPLHDSGEAEGLLYYVMPFVEGESLRDRLSREAQLSVEDALRITREVADALTYAHRLGLVHRDIKPENILLEAGHAVVTDFGLARAIAVASSEGFSGSGQRLGTPAYMSPEQVTADREIDGRADLYALACVLYEMLAGVPPFRGDSVESLLRQHLAEPPQSLSEQRTDIPNHVLGSIHRALAKTPTDRFRDLPQFIAALERPKSLWADRFAGRRRWIVAGSLALGLLVVGYAVASLLSPQHRGATAEPDPNLIVVLPFHVVGDTSLTYLHEGMLDLLAAKLVSPTGPHAADPQSVMRAWRRSGRESATAPTQESALRLARSLGGGRALLGEVVGTSRHLILNVSLLDTSDGTNRGTASVSGSADSLLQLIDRLTGQVLARAGGEDELNLSVLSSTSLPALRLYLTGRAQYRAGQYGAAAEAFRQALARDTSFALAALGLRFATGWVGLAPITTPAWGLRARLSARDRAILTGLAGPHFPAPSSEREFLSAWEAAITFAPAQPEAWYGLGDALYHAGGVLGEDRSHKRTVYAFSRAIQLDSGFAAPIGHLVELAAQQEDSTEVRRLSALYAALDSTSDIADFLRWREAIALGDHATLVGFRARMPSLGGEALRRIVIAVQLDALPLEDASRAAAIWVTRSEGRAERWLQLLRLHDFALNRGAPQEALAWTDSLRALWPWAHAYLRLRIEDGLFGEGDTAAARVAYGTLERMPKPEAWTGVGRRAERDADLCVISLWRLSRGDTNPTPAIIRELLSSPALDSTDIGIHDHWCAIMLQGMLSAGVAPQQHRMAGLRAVDSLLFSGPRSIEILSDGFFRSFAYANLLASRMHEAVGDLSGALDLVRRRPYQAAGTTYLASYLLQEGRLAAQTGDTDGAMRAYRHYLVLRSHPEVSRQSEVARVRAELAKLGYN